MTTISDHTVPTRSEIREVIKLLSREASAYLESLDERPARSKGVQEALENFNEPLPRVGSGAVQALTSLIDQGLEATVATAEDTLNRINQLLGSPLLEDGRVFVGSTSYQGKVGLRPAI